MKKGFSFMITIGVFGGFHFECHYGLFRIVIGWFSLIITLFDFDCFIGDLIKTNNETKSEGGQK